MISVIIFKLLSIVSIILLLNVNTDSQEYDQDYDRGYNYNYNYEDVPDYYDRPLGPLRNFNDNESDGQASKKRIKKVRRKEQIYADLVDPKLSVSEVTARLPSKVNRGITSRAGGYCRTDSCYTCLESCKWLKKSRYSALDITQYTYLRLCSEGCKENLACIQENFCLPVMKENPDFFVLCANKCNLFEVIPQVFRTGQCD